jgi:excisionase family DNA binding protein
MRMINCPNCNRLSEMLTIKEAFVFMENSRRTIYRWIDDGKVHIRRSAGGHTLICKTSLLRPANNRSQDHRMVSSL